MLSAVVGDPFFQLEIGLSQGFQIAMNRPFVNTGLFRKLLDRHPVLPGHQADQNLPLSLDLCGGLHRLDRSIGATKTVALSIKKQTGTVFRAEFSGLNHNVRSPERSNRNRL